MVLVAKGSTTSSQDHVGVSKVLEECWQTESVHATGDDGGGLLHALPLLAVVGTIGLVILQHVGNVLVRGIALHLAEAHGANVDARGTDDTGDLGVHEGSVASLCLRAGHWTMASTVVVQELLGEVAPAAGHCCSTCNVAIHQEGAVLRQRTELGHDVLAPGDHLLRVIRSDVGREELGAASLLDGSPHGLHNLRNAFVHLAEDLVALGLIVLDEVTTLPEGVACLTERLGLQTQLWLDDGANHKTTIGGATAKNAPHVFHVDCRSIIEPQECGRQVKVIDLAILHITHALIVSNGQGQEGAHHSTAINDVAVEEQSGVGNLHLFIVRVDVVHQGIHRLGEVICGANIHVGSCGGLSGKVSSCCQVVIAGLGLHDVGNQHVLAVPDECVLVQGQVRIAAGLVQSLACNCAFLLGWNAGTNKCCCGGSLGPVKGCCLHGGLTSVAQLLLPARVDLVSVLLEGQECALDLLMGLGILNHSIAQADVAELASLPLLPGLLTLTAGDGTNLGTVLCQVQSCFWRSITQNYANMLSNRSQTNTQIPHTYIQYFTCNPITSLHHIIAHHVKDSSHIENLTLHNFT